MYNFFNAWRELCCKVKLILGIWKHLMNCQFCCQNQANRYSLGKFKGRDAYFSIEALQWDVHIESFFIFLFYFIFIEPSFADFNWIKAAQTCERPTRRHTLTHTDDLITSGFIWLLFTECNSCITASIYEGSVCLTALKVFWVWVWLCLNDNTSLHADWKPPRSVSSTSVLSVIIRPHAIELSQRPSHGLQC